MSPDIATALQYDNGSAQDPVLSLTNYLTDTLYIGGSDTREIDRLISGAFVSIREAPPTENNACLSPARFDQDLGYCSNALAEKEIKFKAA